MTTPPRQRFAILVAMLLAGSGVLGCDRNAEPPVTREPPPRSVEGIVESSETLIGKRITVAGEVDEIRGERAFVLQGNDWVFEDDILVVTSSPLRLAGIVPEEGDDLIVTGTVRTLDRALAEEVLGPEPDEELMARWDGKLVIMASAIDGIERRARWSSNANQSGTVLSVWTVYAVPSPKALAGGRIELENVTVRSKATAGLWVGYTHGAQIFVLPQDTDAVGTFDVGSRVDVEGVLREMPEAGVAIQQWGIKPSLRAQVAEEPLYIADATLEPSRQSGTKTVQAERGPE